MTEKQWIDTMVPLAQMAQKKFGYLVSVLTAQACLENGYGMDKSCDVLTQAHNVLGMKRELLNSTWKSNYWKGTYITKETPEWGSNGKYYKADDFRSYESFEACLFDYCQFMRDARYSIGGSYKYRDVLSISDPKALITTVAGRGYCTDPGYPVSIMRIIEKHNLTQYDAKPQIIRTVRSIMAGYGKTLVDLIAANRSEVPYHNANSHKFLVIHYLGVDGADNPYLYDHGYGGHFYVPINGIKAYQAAEVTDQIWHVGANSKNGYRYIHKEARNTNCVGIEIGTFKDALGRWQFTEAAQETAAEVAAAIMLVYDIPLRNLLRHGDVTTKCCPEPLMPSSRGGFEGQGSNWTWLKFRCRVAELMGDTEKTVGDTLMEGSQGDAVNVLQEALMELGFSCGSAGADGIFGKGTHAAVLAFQKASGLAEDGVAGPDVEKALAVAKAQKWLNDQKNAGLSVDGQYGPMTRKALVTALQASLVELCGAKIEVDGEFGPKTRAACQVVGEGDTGALVSVLQAALLVNGARGVKISGSCDVATRDAIKAFQSGAGISIDGLAGRQTFEKLLS